MSTVFIETRGLDRLVKDMEGYTSDLHGRISRGINRKGNAVVLEAKSNHRFTSQTGQLENSVSFEQDRLGNVHTAKIFLNDATTSVDSGRSYGVFIHEGTYQGYEQSPIAPAYSSSVSASGSGWLADPFLYNAIQSKWKLETTLKRIATNMKKKYERL